jgi:hypothetical protein
MTERARHSRRATVLPTLSLTEEDEQIAVFNWIKLNMTTWPELDFVVGSGIGARLNPPTITKMLRTGALKKHWPDIFAAIPRGVYHGLFIELKPMTRGRKNPRRVGPTKGQKKMLKGLASQGYYACACFGHKAAIGVLELYLQGKL